MLATLLLQQACTYHLYMRTVSDLTMPATSVIYVSDHSATEGVMLSAIC